VYYSERRVHRVGANVRIPEMADLHVLRNTWREFVAGFLVPASAEVRRRAESTIRASDFVAAPLRSLRLPESRMREIRLSGLAGGMPNSIGLHYSDQS
jgi:hypothetical protein